MLDDNGLLAASRNPIPVADEGTDNERGALLAKAALWAASHLIDEMDADGLSFYRTPANQARFIAELSQLGADSAIVAFRAFFDVVSDSAPERLLASMAEDFSRLFVGPGPGLAPPFESLYVGAGRYGGSAASELENALARAGLQQTGSLSLPSDHLGVELALLAHWSALGERTECIWLLRQHLLVWVPQWSADVQRHAETHMYRALAALVVDVTERGLELSA